MLVLVTLLMALSTVVVAANRRDVLSLYLCGLSASFVVMMCGVVTYVAKMGGYNTPQRLFLFLLPDLQLWLQGLPIPLGSLGYLVALGRSLFPYFLLCLGIYHSNLAWVRRHEKGIRRAHLLGTAALLVYYWPPVFRQVVGGRFWVLVIMRQVCLAWIVASVLAAVVACTALGVLIERVAYKPLRNAASPLAVLITAIGVSYLLQNLALLIFGPNNQSFQTVVSWSGLSLAGGKLNISGETIVTIIACIVIMVVLMLFIRKSKAGQAMRAVSEDKGAAQLMGINVNGTIALTFAIGSALAAIAGVLLCSAYPSLSPYTGAMPGIKAFVAAVFGGIGSIPGAFIGGILLGVIEILARAYISSQMADAIVFAVLIIVLLVKPTGILGKNIQEKV